MRRYQSHSTPCKINKKAAKTQEATAAAAADTEIEMVRYTASARYPDTKILRYKDTERERAICSLEK